MPLTASKINRWKAGDKEHWEPLGGGCYLVIAKAPKKSKRFVGKTRIGSPEGKLYPVPIGIWNKDFTDPLDALNKWNEMKKWGKENNSDLRNYGVSKTTSVSPLDIQNSSKTLREVFDLYLLHKSQHIKSITTYKSRLKNILLKLPEGIMIDDFAGHQGRNFIKERVCDPSIASGNDYTAMRARRQLNEVFNFALDELSLPPEILPYRLDQQFPFEKNIKSKPHPHLSWEEFTSEFIPALNENLCNASRLTDLSAKAVLMMLQRVSAVVAMQWNWYDDKTNCWIIPPDTTGVKRTFGDTTNAHVIPQTPQLETLMNNLGAINGNQKYVFFSPYKGNHQYISPQTPNDHFKNLNYQGRQDAHGIRHVASTALIEKGHDRDMVSRCLGHLKNDGAIGHYDFSLQLDKRKDIHESWNQLLIKEGLRI